MVISPKGDQLADDATVSRLPEDTRPLSLSNTDAKPFACAMRSAAGEHVSKWSLHIQRGFTRGRQLIDNVVEIERLAMGTSMSPTCRAAMLFFCIAAAFPSVLPGFSLGFPVLFSRIFLGFPWASLGFRGAGFLGVPRQDCGLEGDFIDLKGHSIACNVTYTEDGKPQASDVVLLVEMFSKYYKM